MRIKKITGIFLICWFVLMSGYAQKKPDADRLYQKARDAAFSERYAEARKFCREILSYYPDYYDATVLMGSTYAWELKTDSARRVISPLLDIEPDNIDVLNLLIDNEMWSGQYKKALEWIDQALNFYPSDENLLYKKANAYYAQKDNPNAIKALHELLSVNTGHAGGNELLNTILPSNKTVGELYADAFEEATAGNWKVVRKNCRQVLKVDPDHFDATLLLGQAFAFENKFDSARIITKTLDKIGPQNYEVLELKVNIEIWNRKYKAALVQVDKALAAYPNDKYFLFQKAKIQYLSKDYKEALKTLDVLLGINPNHEEGNALKKNILTNHKFKDYAFLESYFEYNKDPDLYRNLVTSTGVSKWTKYGTYIAKVNFGDDLPMKSVAFQYELEAYQQLFPTNYLWLDYAWSPANHFFPDHRGGIEFFQRLPKGFEVSLGMRFLYWTVDPSLIYTGSISWLHNKNYLAYRPFFCHANSSWIYSHIFTYRRYFSEREDYAYIMLGFGNYSDEFIQFNPNPGRSYLAQIGVLKSLNVRWSVRASVGYARDEDFWDRFQALAGVRYYFNMFK